MFEKILNIIHAKAAGKFFFCPTSLKRI